MDNNSNVIVHTTHGDVRGAVKTSVYGPKYYSFERIPFAKPPLNELRFMAPVPNAPWHPQVLDCTQKAVKPLQKDTYSRKKNIEGSEDCLYLNVYVKELKTAKPLPVLVHLYGGAFEKGDASSDLYGPDYFMLKDVLVVTIAYRVGVLGFLSLDDPELDCPGNAGLKDQLLGMKWFKQNVSNFNGDPDNITLMGESAGAASTHYLMLMPQACGLFHKAILMSGTALCFWARNGLKDLPQRLVRKLGYDKESYTDRELFEYLHAQPGDKLLKPELLTTDDKLRDHIFGFGPVIEPYASEHCVLPKEPDQMLDKAWSNKIPIMLGGTSFEGLLMYGLARQTPYILEGLRDIKFLLPGAVRARLNTEMQYQLGQLIKNAHFGDKEISMENILNYCDYISYKVFWVGIYQAIQGRLRYAANAPTYLYRFDFDSPTFSHQRFKYCGKELNEGVAHVEDRAYLFFGKRIWKLEADSAEYKTLERMIDIWTNFATTSNPNCNSTKDSGQWQPLLANRPINCLNIGKELQIMELPELEKLHVWDHVYASQEC